MLPSTIVKLLDTYCEDELFFRIDKILSSEEGEFKLDLIIRIAFPKTGTNPVQKWRLRTSGIRESHFDFAESTYFKLVSNHPLLREYTDVQTELYFSGKLRNDARLFLDLYKTHFELFGSRKRLPFHWEAFAEGGQFQYTNGSLTKGPVSILTEYGKCLKRNGLDFYFLGAQVPRCTHPLALLFIGDSYLIADAIHFEFIR